VKVPKVANFFTPKPSLFLRPISNFVASLWSKFGVVGHFAQKISLERTSIFLTYDEIYLNKALQTLFGFLLLNSLEFNGLVKNCEMKASTSR